MTQSGDVDPQLKPLQSMEEVAVAAGTLAAQVTLFAETFHQESAEAIAAINPSIAGTEIGDEWPLTWGLKTLFASIIDAKLKGIEYDPTNAASVAGLESGKYHPDALEEAYPDSDNPHLAFATDMIRWVTLLGEKDRPLLVMLDLGEDEGSRLEYSIYEDVEVARSFLQQRTEASLLDPEDVASRYEPYRWVGDRTIVHGSSDQIAALVIATQPEGV